MKIVVMLLIFLSLVVVPVGSAYGASQSDIEKGRKLILLSGCNDCHTLGYPEQSGKIPQKDWLAGSPVGWKGPWGTTYATNLRLYFHEISADEWVELARAMRARPTMPWWVFKEMNDSNLRYMYHFIKSLGPKGKPVPEALPPGERSNPPYYELVLPTAPK